MASPLQALLERMTQAICRGDVEAAGLPDERSLKSVRKWAGA
jgi:hypothetical protein